MIILDQIGFYKRIKYWFSQVIEISFTSVLELDNDRYR